MGRLLTAIGLLIVALFAAAAVAPYLIDWTSQKALFEREASRRFGTQVVVDGRMEVGLLPIPVITLEGVRVGGPGAEARIETMRLDLSLPALIRGDILVTAARLVEPRVSIALDRTGQLPGSWPTPDAAAVHVSSFTVEGGQFTLTDPREGGGRVAVDSLAFSGEAQSLNGPFRIDGSGRYEGRRGSFNLSTGRADGGELRLRFMVEPTDDPISAEFDGALRLAEARPVLAGLLKLRGLGARHAAQRETGWRLETAIEARPQRIEARELRLVPGAEDRMIQFTGAARVALGRDPRLEAALALRQIDFDRLAEVSIDQPSDVAGVLARLSALPVAATTAAIDMDLNFEVGSAVLAGGLIQELQLRVETRDGRWRLSSVEAKLPGNATLKASGNFGLRGGPLVFHGPVELAVRAPTAFSSWLEGELLRPRPTRPATPPAASTVTLAGRVTIAPDRLAIDAFTASVGSAAVSGGAELVDAGRRFVLRLSAPDVDLDPLVGLARALAPRAAGLDIREVDAELRADRLRYRSLDVRGLDVALRSGPGGLVAERLAGVANGLTIAGTARVDATNAGSLALRISGERIAPALAAIESTFGGHPLIELLRPRASALGAVAVAATVTLGGAERVLTVNGTAGGSRVEAQLGVDGLDLNFTTVSRLSLSLANPRLDVLLAQLGIDAVPAPGGASGRVALRLARRGNASTHGLTLDAELAQTRLSGSGEVTLAADRFASNALAVRVESGDVAPLLFALGVPIAEAGEALPARIATSLALDAQQARLTQIEGAVAGQAVRGMLAIARTSPPRLEGSFELAEVGLERVLSLAAGPWPAANPGEAWPSAAFGPRPLPEATGSIAITAGRLRLDRFALDEARFAVRLTDNGLAIDNLSGRLAGGRLTGEIVATRPETGLNLSARLALAGARLEDVIWARNGRPVATAQLDARLSVEGAGRSPSVLLGNLAGEGSVTLGAGELRGIAVGGFTAGLRASEGGLDVEEVRLAELVRSELDSGALPFARLEAALTVQGGVIRASNLTLDGAPAAATGRIAVDLPRWSVDAEATLEGPSARQGQRGPRIGLLFGGSIDAPERRIDVKAFVDYLNLRRFEREVERLEALQREIEQRERLLREMEERERERRARLAPAPTPAPAPTVPATPPAPQAAPPAQPQAAPPVPAAPTPPPPGSAETSPAPAEAPAAAPPADRPAAVPPPAPPAVQPVDRPAAVQPPAPPAATPAPARAAEAIEEPRRPPERPPALAPLPPPVVVPPAPGTPGRAQQPLQLLPQR